MALFLLYEETRSQRVYNQASSELRQFKQFLKRERVFYSKDRIGILLLHHYQFLKTMAPAKTSIAQRPVDTGRSLMHCLRADIEDVCACCPWAGVCSKAEQTDNGYLGHLLAEQLITDVYKTEQRRLDTYLGVIMNKHRRFFNFLRKNAERQKHALYHHVNTLSVSGKEEGHIAHWCRATLRRYQRELSFRL